MFFGANSGDMLLTYIKPKSFFDSTDLKHTSHNLTNNWLHETEPVLQDIQRMRTSRPETQLTRTTSFVLFYFFFSLFLKQKKQKTKKRHTSGSKVRVWSSCCQATACDRYSDRIDLLYFPIKSDCD